MDNNKEDNKEDNKEVDNGKEDNIEALCPQCGNIPLILNIHTDNGKIELDCKECGEYEILIDDYYEELSKNNFFKKCDSCEKEKSYYCSFCKKHYCETCKNKKHASHECFKFDEKKTTCYKHNREFIYYCLNCQENLCEEEKEQEHKDHKLEKISEIIDDCHINDELENINDELHKLVEFNELILKNIEIFQENKLYINSIKNMGKSLEEGNKRESQDIKCLLNELSKGIEISENAIQKLIDEKFIQLNRKDKYIHLSERELEDKHFNYISQIRFNQLKEIDLSKNHLVNIKPIKRMSLPFLEFLNLSDNNITDIKPVAKLNSKKLQYIFLQKNNINNIESFSDSEFPKIKILRAEDNNMNLEDENIKEKIKTVITKFSKKFIYKSIEEQKKEFKEKYEFDNWDSGNIELNDLYGGEEMLKKLFLIISYYPKNTIKKLILRNNYIRDPSILNRINFRCLETLDLAVNEIKDLKFLLEMRAGKLKYLYLDNNLFSDINPLLRENFPKLEVLSLNKNKFDSDKMKEKRAYIALKNRKNKLNKKLEIQLEEVDIGHYKKIEKRKSENKNENESENKNENESEDNL